MYPVCVLHNGGEHACVFVEDLPQALESADADVVALPLLVFRDYQPEVINIVHVLYSNLKSMHDGPFLWRQIVCINILLHAVLQPDQGHFFRLVAHHQIYLFCTYIQ